MEVIISNEKHLSMFELNDSELTVTKGKSILFSEPMVGDTIKVCNGTCVSGVIVATRDTNYECESKDWKKHFKRLKNQPK